MAPTIIAGGQTGADRAALDWAMRQGIPCDGWCPKGRMAEDGLIDCRYPLKETPTASYAERTEWNVRDSDGTVLFSVGPELSGGSLLTLNVARRLKKPLLQLSQMKSGTDAAARLKTFLTGHRIRVLNVAGPRASEEPTVARFVEQTLTEAFHPSRPQP